MTVIHSKRVVLPDGIAEAFVVIENGAITEVSKTLPAGKAGDLTELNNQLLMPGVIDPHVHINEPGRTDWEGFDTATKAAIAGGVTMIVDMPLNSSPVTVTVKAFEEKLAATKNQLHTGVGFWGGIVPGNENEIAGLIKKGVMGFKAFLTHSGIDEFPNATENDLRKVMPVIAKSGLPLLVHCELTDSIQRSTADVTSYSNYLNTRPKKWEDDAISLMIKLCKEFDCRVHIVHLSSANAIEQLQRAKENGLPITAETGQHNLYFNAENIANGQTQFKCAPPIREKENNNLLWQALKGGIIDFVATDHSPCTPGLKEIQSGNFIKAWGGIASLQFALPVLWTAAKKRNGTISEVVKWLCENPAKLIGKEQRKGKIAKGYDADMIVFSEEQTFKVTEQMIQHKHKVTPYLNEELYGVVTQTYISGKRVYNNGVFEQLNKGQIVLCG